jgi:hypothetical protein
MGDLLPHLFSMRDRGLLFHNLACTRMISCHCSCNSESFTMTAEDRSRGRSPMACTPFLLRFSKCRETMAFANRARWPDVCINTTWPRFQTCIDRIGTVGSAKHWAHNLAQLHMMRYFVVTPTERSPESKFRALWNPMCAGTFLVLPDVHLLNQDAGSAVVDSFVQCFSQARSATLWRVADARYADSRYSAHVFSQVQGCVGKDRYRSAENLSSALGSPIVWDEDLVCRPSKGRNKVSLGTIRPYGHVAHSSRATWLLFARLYGCRRQVPQRSTKTSELKRHGTVRACSARKRYAGLDGGGPADCWPRT